MQGSVEEGELEIGGIRVFFRRAGGDGVPTVCCHGNPTHSEEWLPILEAGGPAIAIDMPGWGRSARPDPRRFDYSMHGLSAFLERCLDQLGVGERKLLVHDWGSLALIGAQRRPALVKRLVVINAVPLLAGYRWHWVARIWRQRPLGEIANATTTRSSMALLMRQARGDRSPMPAEFIEMVWSQWDRGTQRALLALYRDADPARLQAAGANLAELSCPALVLCGERDPYIPARFGEALASVLPNARLEILPGAGHWPIVEAPELSEKIVRFLA